MYRGRYNDGSPGYTTDTRSEAAGFTCRVIVFDSEEKATEFMVQDPASVTMFKLFVEPFESS